MTFSSYEPGYGTTLKSASQYALTESRLKKMLEDAFVAGYESPVEFMQQEVDRILREPVEEAQKKAQELSSEPTSAKKKVRGREKFINADAGLELRKIETSYHPPPQVPIKLNDDMFIDLSHLSNS